MSEYSDPSALDASDLSDLGASLTAMGKSFLEDLPRGALESNLADLGTMDFKPADARGMMKKLKNSIDMSSVDADTLKDMGSLLRGLDASDMNDMPASSLDDPDVMSTMSNLDFAPSQARTLLSKLRENNGGGNDLGSNAKAMGKMIQFVSTGEIESTSIADFGLDCSSADSPDLDPEKAQAGILVKKLKGTYGEPSTSNTNYTGDCFSKWGSIAALGMSADDIKKENIFDTNAKFRSVTEAEIEQFGKFLKYMTESQISAITPTNMALIPPTSFSGFSATQIGYFGTSQAAAVTYDQGAALSEDAQAALEAAGGYTADSYSGAGEMMYSGLLLLISGVLARM